MTMQQTIDDLTVAAARRVKCLHCNGTTDEPPTPDGYMTTGDIYPCSVCSPGMRMSQLKRRQDPLTGTIPDPQADFARVLLKGVEASEGEVLEVGADWTRNHSRCVGYGKCAYFDRGDGQDCHGTGRINVVAAQPGLLVVCWCVQGTIASQSLVEAHNRPLSPCQGTGYVTNDLCDSRGVPLSDGAKVGMLQGLLEVSGYSIRFERDISGGFWCHLYAGDDWGIDNVLAHGATKLEAALSAIRELAEVAHD